MIVFDSVNAIGSAFGNLSFVVGTIVVFLFMAGWMFLCILADRKRGQSTSAEESKSILFVVLLVVAAFVFGALAAGGVI